MKSRYLALIDARIESSKSHVERARLEARKATFLARQGDRDGALAISKRLRESFAQAPEASVSAWLHLVDGLLDYFWDLSQTAVGKFQRAQALAVAANVRSVRALSAAWLAHVAFSTQEFESMEVNLVRAFEAALPDDHDALSRCASVCAIAAHFAGDFTCARYWYRAARLHALEEGDDATISAYMHNLVAMSVMNLRQAVLSGTGRGQQEFDLLLEAESAGSYDELVGAISLDRLLPILRANIYSLRGDASRALALYMEHVPSAREQGMERLASWMLADMASCYLRVGEPIDALRLANEAAEHLSAAGGIQVDDESAANSRLAQVYESLGDIAQADRFRRAASEGWRLVVSRQTVLRTIVKQVDARFQSHVLPHRSIHG